MEGDGIFFLIGGLLIAALGLWSILGTPSAAPVLLILSGLAFGGLAFFEFSNVSDGSGGIDIEFAAAVLLWPGQPEMFPIGTDRGSKTWVIQPRRGADPLPG
jgi:hypothetical protein